MRVYTGEIEVIWSVPGWAPIIYTPKVTYRYDISDLTVPPTRPVKFYGGQVSGCLVKNHPVTRVIRSHSTKKRRPKGGASIRRWWS